MAGFTGAVVAVNTSNWWLQWQAPLEWSQDVSGVWIHLHDFSMHSKPLKSCYFITGIFKTEWTYDSSRIYCAWVQLWHRYMLHVMLLFQMVCKIYTPRNDLDSPSPLISDDFSIQSKAQKWHVNNFNDVPTSKCVFCSRRLTNCAGALTTVDAHSCFSVATYHIVPTSQNGISVSDLAVLNKSGFVGHTDIQCGDGLCDHLVVMWRCVFLFKVFLHFHSAVQEDDERVWQFRQCYLLSVTLCAVMRHLPHSRVQISNAQLALDVSWVLWLWWLLWMLLRFRLQMPSCK